MKISILQILTSKFEALKMNEEETTAEFNVRIRDLTSESFALEEKLSDIKLVRKLKF